MVFAEIAASKGLYDQVFTADSSLSLIDKNKEISIISKFSHWGRSEETKYQQFKINQLYNNRVFKHSNFAMEGCGDHLYDVYRDVFWWIR